LTRGEEVVDSIGLPEIWLEDRVKRLDCSTGTKMLLMMIVVEIMEDDEKGCLLFNRVAWDYKQSTPEVAQPEADKLMPKRPASSKSFTEIGQL
jgi:hypothetical protein